MQGEDTAVGLIAHYLPMAKFINERGYIRGIEIGTAYGGLANHILSNCCQLRLLVTIDPYRFYPDMPGLFDQDDYNAVKEQTRQRLSYYNERAVMINMTSEEAASGLNQDAYDFVFIDGLHKYNIIRFEIETYRQAIRNGGALMGHDYNLFEDVNKAVDELYGDKVKQLPGNIWYIEYSDL
jgi:hypothetical protein